MRWALALLLALGGLLALGFSDENAEPWEPVTVEPATTEQGQVVERRVLGELADIDASLGRAHDQLAALDAAEIALAERRDQHAAELAAVSEELANRRAEIKRRVYALYRVHRRGLATVIFGVDDALDLRRRAAYLLWLVRAESGPLADVAARMRDRERASKALDEDTAALKKNHDAASALQQRLVDQRTARVQLLTALRGGDRGAGRAQGGARRAHEGADTSGIPTQPDQLPRVLRKAALARDGKDVATLWRAGRPGRGRAGGEPGRGHGGAFGHDGARGL